MIVGSGLFLLGAMLAVNLALGHHADRILDSATLAGARHGASQGALTGGSRAEAVLVTDRMIERSGRSLFETWSTTAVIENDGGRRRIVVETRARLAGPLGSWPVSATGSAVLEEFTPQGDRP